MKAAVAFLLLLTAAPGFAQSWTDTQEAEVKGLFRDNGFFLVLQKVVRGQSAPEALKPWVDRLGEDSLVGTTVRDALVSLPADPWVENLLKAAPAGLERDWVSALRSDPARVPGGKFHLSLYPVRMGLLSGVSMILPNYDWSISYQDPHQMTVQALEKGYSATLHLRWIDREGIDVLDAARLVQMYAGFKPQYIVTKPQGDTPSAGDLVPLPPVEPRPLAGHPDVLEQVQGGLPDAWQVYAGRTRWYESKGRVLVVLLSVHIERNQKLADRDRALAKIGQLLDTIRLAP